MQTRVTEDGKIYALCGCGRSPTGDCIGWHSLTNEQFQVKLMEYFHQQGAKQELLNEAKK
jgi:CDGSH-type Zn-finger protein